MKKDDAMDLLGRGFCVFPLIPNSKKPAFKGWQKWAEDAGEQEIEDYWTKHPDANIGVATGPSDLIVLDVDVKDGKAGMDSLLEFEITEGQAPTCTASTPSGGLHFYYNRNGREARCSVDKLAEGLDTRAIGGYVVAPGSDIDGDFYTWNLDYTTDMAEAPEWVYPTQAQVVQKDEVEASELDVERAVFWVLGQAPDCIQGEGGDATMFSVVCELRDMGLDTQQIRRPLSIYNDHKCEPRWSFAELQTKIDNAYNYAQNSKGSKALPEFEDISDLTPKPKTIPTFSGADLDLSKIPPRAWIIHRRLLCGFVTATIAPGGTGKSAYSMIEAVVVATGRPLLGEVPKKQGPVVIYNIEDPLDELQRRLCAIALHFEIPFEELKDVHLVSGLDHPISIASTKDGVTGATKDYERIVRLAKDTKALLLILDPFIQIHSVDENSNNAIGFIGRLFSQLATRLNCAVNIVHHTRKLPTGTGAGEMDNARGASALVSAARIATTLTTMSESDAEHLQVPVAEKGWFVRSDNAKGNMQPPASSAEWFRKMSVHLPNGDDVGVLVPQEFEVINLRHQLERRAELLSIDLFDKFGAGEVPMAEVTDYCLSTLAFDGTSKRAMRRMIEEYYEKPVEYKGVKIEHRLHKVDGAQRARHSLWIEKLMSVEDGVEG